MARVLVYLVALAVIIGVTDALQCVTCEYKKTKDQKESEATGDKTCMTSTSADKKTCGDTSAKKCVYERIDEDDTKFYKRYCSNTCDEGKSGTAVDDKKADVYCCDEDGCNGSSVLSVSTVSISILFLLSLALRR